MLQPTIQRVYTLKKSIEIDPTKIDKNDSILRNRNALEKEIDSLIQNIFNLSSRCPEEMRSIYSQISEKVTEKFNASSEIIRCTVPNSFLFLRLLVPAFLAPTTFQVLSLSLSLSLFLSFIHSFPTPNVTGFVVTFPHSFLSFFS